MKITNKLRALAVVPITLAVVVTSTLLVADRRIRNALIQDRDAARMVEEVFELDILAHEYLYLSKVGGERARTQWLSLHKQVESQFSELSGVDYETLEDIRTRHGQIAKHFGAIVENQRSEGMSPQFRSLRKQNLVRKLLGASEEFRSLVSNLAATSRAAAEETQRTANLLVLILVIASVPVLALISGLITRSITKPIAQLRAGTKVIGEGNLDHRVGTEAADEIGDLSRAFDTMAIELETMINELRQSESEVRALNENLELRVEERTAELARSNSELDDFAYVASHDLKAPLRGIDNLAKWISEDAAEELPEKSREHLQKMQQRVQRMEGLLDDMLQYSRAGRVKGRIEEVDTGNLVQELVEMIAPPEGFVVSVADDMPGLQSDRAPLRQVFLNLIANAIKHHDRQDGHIEVAAQQADGFVVFTVTDDGPGIPAEYHERIFKMFQTLRPRDEVEGSGMGLAVIKKVIESQGGSIGVESGEGRGTCFRFTWNKNSPSNT